MPTVARNEHERAVALCRRRIAIALSARQAVRTLIGMSLAGGIAALVARLGLRLPVPPAWQILTAIAAALAAALAAAILLAARSLPSRTAVRALLDNCQGCGGLLMSWEELDLGQWRPAVSTASMPAVKWRKARPLAMLACSIAFAAGCLAVPDRYVTMGEARALDVKAELEQLAEDIEVLKQEDMIPPERAQVLERTLDQVQSQARGEEPAKTLEALDHLEQLVSAAASEAAEAALKQVSTLQEAQQAAEALGQEMAQGSQELTESMAELAKLSAEAAQSCQSLAGPCGECQQACRSGSLTEAQLRELSQALEQAEQGELKRLARMAQAGLVNSAQLEALKACCQADGDGQCPQESLLAGSGKGRGGVTRGRGDAEMTWSQGSSDQGSQFKEKVLPPGTLESLKQARLVGLSAADPNVTADAELSVGALGSAQGSAGSAHTRVILPEHRGAVQRYFDRAQKP